MKQGPGFVPALLFGFKAKEGRGMGWLRVEG
jgi:hypothetical protein